MAVAAGAATVLVVAPGAFARAPLAKVPENTLKYWVGMMLLSFGTFWAVEGLGVLRTGGDSFVWPGSDAAILVLLGGWFLLGSDGIRCTVMTPSLSVLAVARGCG